MGRIGGKCDSTALREILVICGGKAGVQLYTVDVLVMLETLEKNILTLDTIHTVGSNASWNSPNSV